MNRIIVVIFAATVAAIIALSGAARAVSPAQPKNIDPPKTEEEVNAVIKLLDDDNVDVQVAAALALGQAKAEKAAPALIRKFKALPEFTPTIRREEAEKAAKLGANIAAALGLIGDPKAVPVLIKRREFYFLHQGEAPLAWIGAAAVPALLEVARDKSDPRRDAVCQIISSIKDPAAVPILMEVLNTPGEDSRVKVSALAALAKMGTPGIEKHAEKILSGQNDSARLGALYWLLKYNKAAYAPRLIEFLQDKSWYVRAGAARYAGDFEVREAAHRLLELLNDKEASVRRDSLRALEKLGGVKAKYTAIDDRHARAIITWDGETHETVLDDMGLVRDLKQQQTQGAHE